MENSVAYNVFGVLGAVCWSIQLIPQLIINYRRHSTEGLQRSMMFMWALAGVPLGVYNIVNEFNIALLIQPQILTTLSLLTWIQCYYYEDKWSLSRCSLTVSVIGIILGGIETALIFALRTGLSREIHWPVILMGVLSAVLLALGVLRHYYDIFVHRTVRGISFIFVGIDAAGDVFSLISVFFQTNLDILGIVIYATEFVLWCGVFACGIHYNFVPWLRSKTPTGFAKSAAHRETVLNCQESHRGELELGRVGSATSVFRTPSSILSHRGSNNSILS